MSLGDAVQLALGTLFFIFAIGMGIGLFWITLVSDSREKTEGGTIAAFVFFTAVFAALSVLFFGLGGGLR